MKKPNKNVSGIEIDDSPVQVMRTTMKLSRDMGMAQTRKKSWPDSKGKPTPQKPAPAKEGPNFSIAVGNSVACPNCEMEFEILPEFYGALAECEACNCEFTIVPPESSPSNSFPSEPSAPPPSEESSQQKTFSRLEEPDNASTPKAPPISRDGKSVGLIVFVSVTITLLLTLVGVLTYFLLNK